MNKLVKKIAYTYLYKKAESSEVLQLVRNLAASDLTRFKLSDRQAEIITDEIVEKPGPITSNYLESHGVDLSQLLLQEENVQKLVNPYLYHLKRHFSRKIGRVGMRKMSPSIVQYIFSDTVLPVDHLNVFLDDLFESGSIFQIDNNLFRFMGNIYGANWRSNLFLKIPGLKIYMKKILVSYDRQTMSYAAWIDVVIPNRLQGREETFYIRAPYPKMSLNPNSPLLKKWFNSIDDAIGEIERGLDQILPS